MTAEGREATESIRRGRRCAPKLALLLVAVIGLVVVHPACGGGQPMTVSRQISAADGGTVSLGRNVVLQIPAGALPTDATVTIAPGLDKVAPPAELDGAKRVGPAFYVDLGGQQLSKPVVLEVAFEPDLVPEGSPQDVVFLAFYDEEKGQWVPVYGTVDLARHVVVVETDHLSWWNPFSWDLSELWAKISRRIESLLESVGLPVAEIPKCGPSPRYMTVEFNDLLLACIEDTGAEGQALLRVANNRAYAVLVHLPPAVQSRRVSPGSLSDAAAAFLEEKLGQGAVYIPAAGDAEFSLQFREAGDIRLLSAPSDFTLALDTLLIIFSMVGADPDNVIDGLKCLFEVMAPDTPEQRTLGDLLGVAKECAGVALKDEAGIVWAAIRTFVTVGAGTGELLVDRTFGGDQGEVTVTYSPPGHPQPPEPASDCDARPTVTTSPETPAGIYVNPEDRWEYLELEEGGEFSYRGAALLGGILRGQWRTRGEEIVLTYYWVGFQGSARGEIRGNAITVDDEDGEVWADGWIREKVPKKGGVLSLTVGARYTIEVLDHYLTEPGANPCLYLEYTNATDEPIRVRISIRWEDGRGLFLKDGGQENTRGPIAPGQIERLIYRPRADLPPEAIVNYSLEIHAAEWDRLWLPHVPVGPEIEPEQAPPPSGRPTSEATTSPAPSAIPSGGGHSGLDQAYVHGTYVNEDNPSEYLELDEDGTFFLKEEGIGWSGEWEIDGDTITFHLSAVGLAARATIEDGRILDEDGKVWVRE